ncbi:MAG: HepT-like ribonuclease domain-containing protein [Candidatus Bathyarchaeia archaeon]
MSGLKIMARVDQQIELVTGLLRELDVERSYRGIERLVQSILQALLDLGLMVISALGGKAPERYSDMGVLGRSDGGLLRSMAGMRNVLVHAYADIKRDLIMNSVDKLKGDAVRISGILRESLGGKSVDPEIADKSLNLSGVLKGRVEAAFLFGGRAKGYSVKGDYDVAVYFGRPFNLYELGGS